MGGVCNLDPSWSNLSSMITHEVHEPHFPPKKSLVCTLFFWRKCYFCWAYFSSLLMFNCLSFIFRWSFDYLYCPIIHDFTTCAYSHVFLSLFNVTGSIPDNWSVFGTDNHDSKGTRFEILGYLSLFAYSISVFLSFFGFTCCLDLVWESSP